MSLPQASQARCCCGAALGAGAEPGQSQPEPEPFPCSVAVEQDGRATVSPPGTAGPQCQGNQPAMRDRQMVVGFFFFLPLLVLGRK